MSSRTSTLLVVLLVALALSTLFWTNSRTVTRPRVEAATTASDSNRESDGSLEVERREASEVTRAIVEARGSGQVRQFVVRVVGIDSVPIRGAEVRIARSSTRRLVESLASVRTDEHGTALLPWPELATAVVEASADGFVPGYGELPVVDRDLLVTLHRGARLRVRCADQRGAPLAGIAFRAWARALACESAVGANPELSETIPIHDQRDLILDASTDSDGVVSFGPLTPGVWMWSPVDESLAVIATTVDSLRRVELTADVDCEVEATLGTVLAAVLRVQGDDVLSAAWTERRGPRVMQSGERVHEVVRGLSRRFPDAQCVAAIPIAVPPGAELDSRSLEVELLLAARGAMSRTIELQALNHIQPIDIDVHAEPPQFEASRVRVVLQDRRGHELEGVGLDLRERERGIGFPVVSGSTRSLPVGKYAVSSVSNPLLGRSLKAAGPVVVEGATELVTITLPVDVAIRRLRVRSASGYVPRQYSVATRRDNRTIDSTWYSDTDEVEVCLLESTDSVKIEAFGFEPVELFHVGDLPDPVNIELRAAL